MFVTLIVLFVSTLAAYILYVYKRNHNFYDVRDIKYLPGLPIFGNAFQSTFFKRHTVEDVDEVYKAFPDEKYVGYIDVMTPTIIIRDPEIIRDITVKNFDHFVDHKEFLSVDVDPLFGGMLSLMKGEKWKDMRTTLSPAFTSSKMRMMMPFMTSITSNIIEFLRNRLNEDIDVDDLANRYTVDVIASTAYGVQVNSVKDKDNEFFKIGQDVFEFGFKQKVMFFTNAVAPSLLKKFGMRIFPQWIVNFFINLLDMTLEHRQKNNIMRSDMIQLLMDASKEWSTNDLMSQLFEFFIAGFESSSTAVAMTIHELALNPGIQERLYQEIIEHNKQDGELTFNSICTLKYLDCVMNETLRKWSPAIFMDRVCSKTYELPPSRKGARPVKVQRGTIIYNMVNCIQMDPKYFPNPEQFDPHRYRDDKKHIQPFTFMPFGMGPRTCIAQRFADLEVKIFLYYLLLNFKILKCPKTADPIQLKPHNISIRARDGTWVRLEARQ